MSLTQPPTNIPLFDKDGIWAPVWIDWLMELVDLIPSGDLIDEDSTQTMTNKTLISPTLTTPTIASFVNAAHNHSNAAGGGTVDHGVLTGLTDNDHAQYLLLAGGTMTGGALLRDLNNANPVVNKPAGTAREIAFNSNTIVGFFGCTVTGGAGASTWVAL